MLNSFDIQKITELWDGFVFEGNVKYVDIVAGDKVEFVSSTGYQATFIVSQLHRNIEKGRIFFDPVPKQGQVWADFTNMIRNNPSVKGRMTVIEKTTLRPKFWRYYDEWITPIFTTVYQKVVTNPDGRAVFHIPLGLQWPKNIAAEIISSTGKYSGVYKPLNFETSLITRAGELYFDFIYNGDDTGVLVYTETPYEGPILGDQPYIDTTQPVPTIVNPTNEAIVVTSSTDSGQTFTQVVQPGESQEVLAPVEKTPDPPFIINETVLKNAVIPTEENSPEYIQPVLTDEEYKVLISAKMDEIRSNAFLIKQIQDNYSFVKMGYTQYIAHNAIMLLKESGIIPIDWKGTGLWGQAEWVKNNYPYDNYIVPVVKVDPVITPVIEVVNPNPGATPTENTNPGSTESIPPTTTTIDPNPGTQTPVDTNPGSVTQPVTETPIDLIDAEFTPVEVKEAGILSNPLVKLVLAVLGILIIAKLFSK